MIVARKDLEVLHMKKIVLILALLVVSSYSAPKKTFGLGGYFQLVNKHERGGLIVRYNLEKNFGVEAIISSNLNSDYSFNARANSYWPDVFKFPKGELVLVAGGGAGFAGWEEGSAVKLLASLGVAYEFEGPVDLFILVDPTLQLDLDEGAENKKMVPVKFGARYYFF